jgi:hypothetical protein
MFKKPYEISLWDDRLIWHRRKLVLVDHSIEFTRNNPYKRGIYYIEDTNENTSGVATYKLCYDDYDSTKIYYKTAPLIKGNYI